MLFTNFHRNTPPYLRQRPESLPGVGLLCLSRGKQRFSVAQWSSILILRFSAGLDRHLRHLLLND
jgi:hypothetical protein